MSESKKPFHGYNKEKHSRTGGLSSEYREKYNRKTGSNLQAPVTESNPKGKDKKRKDSFCARMSGVKGPTSKDGKLTPKGAALKRWKCSKSQTDIDAVFKEDWKKQTPKRAQEFFSGKEGERMKKPNLFKSEMPSLVQVANNEIKDSFIEKSDNDEVSRKGARVSAREVLDLQLSQNDSNLFKTGPWCGPEKKKKKETKKSIGPIGTELEEDYDDQKRVVEDTHAESMHSDIHQDVIDALNDICAADFHHAGVHNLENSDRRKPMKVPHWKFYTDPVKSEREEADLSKAKKDKKKGRCWEGYEPVPGKKPFEDGSCRKKSEEEIELDLEKSFDQDELFLKGVAEKLEASEEIEKARYTKRTGTPGNYRYYYNEGKKFRTGKPEQSHPAKDPSREQIQEMKEKRSHEQAVKDFKNMKSQGLDDRGSSALEGNQSESAKKFVDMLLGTNGLSMKQMSGNRLIVYTEKNESMVDRAAKIAGLDAGKITNVADNGETRVLTIPLDSQGPNFKKSNVFDDIIKAIR